MTSSDLRLQQGFYVTGGTLRGDAACYVVRSSDEELYDGLKRGEFCYVLTARQMGKSSLMVRAAARLRGEGSGVAILDLTAIGQNLDPEQWYGGLINQMGLQLNCEEELEDFWDEHLNLGPLQRWMQAVRQVVLPRYPGPVVVFIDEIDSVRSLPFSTDEFFAGIREFYNYRSEDPELERLTFCLLGVASPADLIQDTRTTPFNIGRRIELRDFTESEALQLAQGLNREEETARALLGRVLYWTGGHPYLTQRLCLMVAEDTTARGSRDVDRICAGIFFSRRAREQDDNLLFVRERMLRSEVDLAGLLTLYGQVRRRKRVADDERNPLVTILRLAGITRVEDGRLKVRNRIYQRVFDRGWVKTSMPDAELRRQREAYRRGLIRAGAISLLIILLITFLTFMAVDQRNRAQAEASRADRNAEENRRNLYVAQMKLASRDWEEGNFDRIRKNLRVQLPQPGEEDLRDFEWYLFWKLCHQDALTLRHGTGWTWPRFSPDGSQVVSGGFYSEKAWDANDGRFLRTLVQHQEGGYVWWGPDQELKASIEPSRRPEWFSASRCDVGGTLKITEVATGRQVRALDVKGLCQVSSDLKTLVTTPDRETIQLLDSVTGNESATLRVNRRFAVKEAIAFSEDGTKLAVGNFFGHFRELPQIILWDLKTQERILELHDDQFEQDNVGAVFFSPDERRLISSHAAGLAGGVVKFWDLATGRLSLMVEGASAHDISPDGRSFAGPGRNRTVRVWDATSGEEVVEFKGHGNRVGQVKYSPDGKKLVSGDADGMVKVWDLERGPVPIKLRVKETISLDFSPDGSRLVSTNRDGRSNSTIRLWDTATWQEIFAIKGDRIVFRSVRFSPDGKQIALSDQHQVKICDASTGSELMTLEGHSLVVEAIAYSPDGSRIASASLDKTVKLWDSTSGQELFTLEGYPGQVYCVAFSPDGARLASGSADGMVKIWDVATGEEISTLEEKGGVEIFSLAYSPNGKLLASGGYGAVTLRETDGYKVIRELEGHSASVRSIDFSPDGERLVTADVDGTTKLWNAATGEELITLGTRTGGFGLVAFSPDGGSLVPSDGESILVWRGATEDEVLRRRQSDQ